MQRTVTPLISALLAASCTSNDMKSSSTVNVPEKLKSGPNETLAMIVPAKGVQIYECREKKGQPGVHEWTFVAPEAVLLDQNGKIIGKHYAGPHWEAADGSKLVGVVKERADAPSAVDIPWLLLKTTSVGTAGEFSNVTSIQRLNTNGGAAPKDGCSQADAGKIARVGYTADYYFLKSK
jgi:hypothetical protein